MAGFDKKPHHNLNVWQRSIDLVTTVYKLTDKFPAEEKFGLTHQMRRAAVSIPSNIAEGAARKTKKEFDNFLSISQGSAAELETQIIIATRLGYCKTNELDNIFQLLNNISRMITGLKRSIK